MCDMYPSFPSLFLNHKSLSKPLSNSPSTPKLSEDMMWVGSVWFAVILGVLMAVEVLVDKIPHVAHLLHAVLVVVHPIAGTELHIHTYTYAHIHTFSLSHINTDNFLISSLSLIHTHRCGGCHLDRIDRLGGEDSCAHTWRHHRLHLTRGCGENFLILERGFERDLWLRKREGKEGYMSHI